MRKAVWEMDYDFHKDKCFDRPTCPECQVPLFSYHEDNEHVATCCYCNEDFELADDMLSWFKEREGSMVTTNEYCVSCGQNKMTHTSYKNVIDLKWQVAFGECENCGAKFIV